jgi:hypothetical protein
MNWGTIIVWEIDTALFLAGGVGRCVNDRYAECVDLLHYYN